MSTPFEPPKKEQPSTYFVQDRQSQQELERVLLQDRMLTSAMGGVLPEQDNLSALRRVLDIGCGSGGWAIDVARTYPEMSLIGIDISQRMIDYAREQAVAAQVADRVEFHVMDALLILEFPNNFFDLVNLRLGVSFLRTWDWPKMLSEMLRVTRLGGIIRLTDNDILHQSTSPALRRLQEVGVCTLFRAGNLFIEEGTGLITHLPRLLTQHGCQEVQTKSHVLEFRAGTEQGQAYCEDMARVIQTARPFVQKWGCAPADYAAIYQQALVELQQPDFQATWNYLTAWGVKP